MRISLIFSAVREQSLLLSHQKQLQALIYHIISESDHRFSKFLHDTGFQEDSKKRARFKFFNFSQVLREDKLLPFYINDQKIIPMKKGEKFLIIISSPVKDIIGHIVMGYFKHLSESNGFFHLGTCEFYPEIVESLNDISIENNKKAFRTLYAPVVYKVKPEQRINGNQFLTLENKEIFQEKLMENTIFKYKVYKELIQDYKKENDSPLKGNAGEKKFHIELIPFPRDENQEERIYYKRHTRMIQFDKSKLIGYSGRVEIMGEPDMIKFIYDAGLGHSCSTGAGILVEE